MRVANCGTMHEALEVFSSFASSVGLRLSDSQRESLKVGAAWLATAARASGLSQYRDPGSALLRAMGPALSYFAFDTMPRTGIVADLGSGSGAVGATIALLAPELQIHLVDRAKRAYTAAELLVSRMRLVNATPVNADIGQLQQLYDGVVFRALAPGPEALAAAARILRPHGYLGAFHRVGDSSFQSPVEPLRVVGTSATTLPELSITCYRR
mgnify:CR=1 FL=1